MRFDILRRTFGESTSYIQSFRYAPSDDSETVATALTALNESTELLDINGNRASPIRWDCGCLQKKCGACAMVIDGKPALACGVKLKDCTETVRLEPLKKFPVVEDLVVDRSVLFENLKTMKIWLEKDAALQAPATAYDASRCLQCGCCLEVCPNFYPGGTFTGMAAAVPMTRVLLSEGQRKDLARLYRTHIYEGCGKSMSCRNICPANIDIDQMLVNSSAVAVWKRLFRIGGK